MFANQKWRPKSHDFGYGIAIVAELVRVQTFADQKRRPKSHDSGYGIAFVAELVRVQTFPDLKWRPKSHDFGYGIAIVAELVRVQTFADQKRLRSLTTPATELTLSSSSSGLAGFFAASCEAG